MTFSYSCKEQTILQIPHLEKRGNATHLIVDGNPFLVLGGELRNPSSSSREYMKEYWPVLQASGMNTVLAVVEWAPVEPEEGKFENGAWIRGRRLNGDDIMLDYDLAKKALENKTGTGLKFGRDNESVQRVKLYRYE